MVAATDRGICAIEFADDPATLISGFQDRFCNAHLIGADGDFERLIAIVIGAVEAPHLPHTLSLDVRGTVFQERVWQALRTIPPGATRTYTQLAAMIGSPSATRAVANACGANRIAFAIPCHRVIRTDGGLGGYRWGIARKQNLLDREAGR